VDVHSHCEALGMSDVDDAHTPLDDEERDGLIPAHLTTRRELNEWEGLNIAQAYAWLARRHPTDVLAVDFLRALHQRMFGDTWAWAGKFRTSDKNISPHAWPVVPMLMHDLVENTRVRQVTSPRTDTARDELAVRFHHELVRIHPWPNGNGRHSRLATDLLLVQWGRPVFTWGAGASLETLGEARGTYIRALRSADAGDYTLLRTFCRT